MKWFRSYIFLLLITCSACSQQKQDINNQSLFAGHYDLNIPQVFKMPKDLNEISGITFYNGDPNVIYAEQDEDGKVFTFHLGDEHNTKTRFGGKGDYEDIQILNNNIVMLRSDGTLYLFPLNEVNKEETINTKEFKNVLPNGEYEGLYADNKNHKLYVLCKSCRDKQDKKTSLYILSINNNNDLKLESNTSLNVKSIAEKVGTKKITFHPSALAKNENTNEWFILSSVNKYLVLTSENFAVKEVFNLDPKIYNQPEGIAFDTANNLYISNEKGNTPTATVLKIAYKNK